MPHVATLAPATPGGRNVAEQAVIADFDYQGDDLVPLFDLEDQLEEAIDAAGVGEFDGNEMAIDLADGSLYMYGPDAEALYAVVGPILAGAACLQNTRVTLRFGPPEEGVHERVETPGS
ncbi:MAG: hypothetical protein U0800_16210 [Isosphaeraceae bacterium]